MRHGGESGIGEVAVGWSSVGVTLGRGHRWPSVGVTLPVETWMALCGGDLREVDRGGPKEK